MLTYAAVGATRDDDLLARPPAGFRPLERLVRLGEGEALWRWASDEVMSLGVQRRVGLREEAFLVERRDDGSVWLRIRAFSRPAHPLLWIGYPVLRAFQEVFTRRYERALLDR